MEAWEEAMFIGLLKATEIQYQLLTAKAPKTQSTTPA